MNKQRICIIISIGAVIISLLALFVGISENTIQDKEYEFLKAFAISHIDESDPNWECKKTIGMYELAKQSYPHFIENTKWLADKKCGFDVSNITP